jgi:hypothetical protein
MSYTERFKAQVGDAYYDRRLAVVRGKMLEYDLAERKMQEAEKQGDKSGAEYFRKQLPAFEEKIKTTWLPEIEKVMVHVRHEREVEKAREEQGFAKAREEAMAKSVVDFSQVFAEQKQGGGDKEDLLKATGLGKHMHFGEKHTGAKLNDTSVQQLRREYWATGGDKREGRKAGEHQAGTYQQLAEKYGVNVSTAVHAVRRESWMHLPRVEGEPAENLKRLSNQELAIKRKAKALGVEPVRSELGRLALPADVVAKLRAEAKAKKEEAKAKKNSPAGE